jgi:hypothetical protein
VNLSEQYQRVVVQSLRAEGCQHIEVPPPLRLDYGWSPHAYVNQRLQIQLELPMMSGMPLEHVEPSMNGGLINSITKLHLVGYFY